MSCKIVMKWLENDDILTDEQMSWLEEHMASCDSCRAYYDDVMVDDIEGLYSSKDIDVTAQVMNKVTKKSKKIKYISIAAAVLLTIVFNRQIIAFAEKLPLIGDLLKFYSEEKSVKYLNENEFELFSFDIEQDGYTLHLQDIYQDDRGFEYKMAVSKGEESITKFSYKITFENTIINYYKENLSKDPWMLVNKLGDFNNIKTLSIKIENKEIVIDMAPYKIVPNKYKVINYNLTSNHSKIQPVRLEVHPGHMYLVFKEDDTQWGVDMNVYDVTLSDEKGKQYFYDASSHHDGTERSLKLTPSIYYEDFKTLTIDEIGYDVPSVDQKITTDNLSLTVKDNFVESTYDMINESVNDQLKLRFTRVDGKFDPSFVLQYRDNEGDLVNLRRTYAEVPTEVEIPDHVSYGFLQLLLDSDLDNLSYKQAYCAKENYLNLDRPVDIIELSQEVFQQLIEDYHLDVTIDMYYSDEQTLLWTYDDLETIFNFPIYEIEETNMYVFNATSDCRWSKDSVITTYAVLDLLNRENKRGLWTEFFYSDKEEFHLTKGMITSLSDYDLEMIVNNEDILNEVSEKLQEVFFKDYGLYKDLYSVRSYIEGAYAETDYILNNKLRISDVLMFEKEKYDNPSGTIYVLVFDYYTKKNIDLKLEKN